jgi:hypothetical protein
MNHDKNHAHCYHLHRGPIWMVIPDGHVVMKCCGCPHTVTVHADHAAELPRHSKPWGGGKGGWRRGGGGPTLSCAR